MISYYETVQQHYSRDNGAPLKFYKIQASSALFGKHDISELLSGYFNFRPNLSLRAKHFVCS